MLRERETPGARRKGAPPAVRIFRFIRTWTRNLLEKYRFGARTRKTGLAVLICLLLDYALGYNAPLNACIAAILTMQATQRESLSTGVNRLLGTAIGGITGLVLLALLTLYPHGALRVGLAALGVMLCISVCCLSRIQEAAAIAAIVVLGVVLEKNADNTLLMAFMLVVETAVGVLVAMGVNWFVSRPKGKGKEKEAGKATKKERAEEVRQEPPSGEE